VEELARFLGTVVLGGHMGRLPEEEREPFATAVAKGIAAVEDPPVLDYVRLNMTARRAA
jgi:trans-aconitate 2-methyltransferase